MKKFFIFFLFLAISFPSYSLATSGCCSWHGGVCGCNTATGSQQCCDGSDSPSCGCTYIPPKPIKTTLSTTAVDYKSIATSLQSTLDTCKSKLDDSTKNLSDKEKLVKQNESKISELNKTIDNRNGWIWFLSIVSFFAIAAAFEKKF